MIILCSIVIMTVTASAAWALESDRGKPLVFEANKLTADEQAQVTTLTGEVLLKQGTLEINGRVAKLFGPVTALDRLVVRGDPARLSQSLDDPPGELQANAQRIEYNFNERRIELFGDAVVTQGQRRLSGEHIVYDLATGRIVGEGGEGRVRIRVTPEPETGGAESQP